MHLVQFRVVTLPLIHPRFDLASLFDTSFFKFLTLFIIKSLHVTTLKKI